MDTYVKRLIAGAACAAMLFSGTALAELKQGDRSSAVKKLQLRLIELNYLPEDTETTKSFGPLTKKGVKAFQERNGLKATGVLDEKTESAVYGKNAKTAKKPVEAPKNDGDDKTAAAAEAASAAPNVDTNIVLTNDPAYLQAHPELLSDPNFLKNNPGLSQSLISGISQQSLVQQSSAQQGLSQSLAQQGFTIDWGQGGQTSSSFWTSSTQTSPQWTWNTSASGDIEAVIQYGMTLRGMPYKNGGRGPDSFDCSGFIGYIFGQFGYKKPGSAQDISDYAAWPTISNTSELMRGDIVLFHTSGRGVTVGHAGVYLGDGTFLHAEPDNGVTITPMFDYNSRGEKTYYHKNYLWAKRAVK